MTYFKKIGRLTDEEQAVINAIEKQVKEKGIPSNEIPECKTLDDLLEVQILVEAYENKDTTAELDIEPEVKQEEDLEQETSTNIELSNAEEIKPIETSILEDVDTEIIDVELEKDKPDSISFVSNDYDPFSEEIIERSYNVEETDLDTNSVTENILEEEEGIELKESSSTPVDDLNPNTKKKAAEQTANAILKGYARMAPIPFKWLAKVNESKVKKLEFEGHIDISLEVSEGMTFDDYMKQTNEQVDEIFTVEGDTLEEIREPLIEVLMEQEMELTPQQRLLMAVVSHLFQMLTAALSLRKQNNNILDNQISIMREMRSA